MTLELLEIVSSPADLTGHAQSREGQAVGNAPPLRSLPTRRGLIAIPLPGRSQADWLFWALRIVFGCDRVRRCEQRPVSYSPDHPAVRFREAACAASSARVVMPSLAKMWDRCTLTVPGAMNSRRAMASLRRPSLTMRTTSSSAGVRLAQPAAGRLRPPPVRAA